MPDKRIILSLVLVTFFCWCSYIGYDSSFFYNIKPYLKHLLNFSLIVAVAITGHYGLKAYPQPWILPLWVFTYVTIILALLLFGFIDLLARISNFSLRELVFGLRMFFTSPVPLGIVIFLANRFNSAKKTASRTTPTGYGG